MNTATDKNKQKILIVDDDEFLLHLYSEKFKKAGFEVEVITSSDKALEKLRAGFRPDVLLLDIVMPGMDGIELLSEIRKEKLAEPAAVIFLTNQSAHDDIERAKHLNIAGYIVKASSIPSEVLHEVQEISKKHQGK